MKKVVEVKDLCCERCANRLAVALELCDGVLKAKAQYKKNCLFVEVLSSVTDERLASVVEKAGFEVLSVRERKGLFA